MRCRLTCLITAMTLVACGDKQPPAAEASLYRPVASIQEIMQSIVDPSADALWDAVSSTVTSAGVEDKQPRTPEDWLKLRHQAIQLVEASNLLVTEGRAVAHEGHQLEDAHVQGILKAHEIQQKIDADRDAFAARAHALQQAALKTLAAIDQKSIDGFIQAGGQLDQACEACHQKYWYPNDKRPSR